MKKLIPSIFRRIYSTSAFKEQLFSKSEILNRDRVRFRSQIQLKTLAFGAQIIVTVNLIVLREIIFQLNI